jgi:opacity protein-like surface antigen
MRLSLQAIAGLAIRLNDQAKVDLTYRYVRSSKVKWDSYNLDEVSAQGDVPITPRVGNFSANYGSSMLTVGFRYAFGRR